MVKERSHQDRFALHIVVLLNVVDDHDDGTGSTFCDQPDREKSNDHQLQIEDCKPVCIMGAGAERKRSSGQRKGSAAWYYRIKHVGVHIFAIKLL